MDLLLQTSVLMEMHPTPVLIIVGNITWRPSLTREVNIGSLAWLTLDKDTTGLDISSSDNGVYEEGDPGQPSSISGFVSTWEPIPLWITSILFVNYLTKLSASDCFEARDGNTDDL